MSAPSAWEMGAKRGQNACRRCLEPLIWRWKCTHHGRCSLVQIFLRACRPWFGAVLLLTACEMTYAEAQYGWVVVTGKQAEVKVDHKHVSLDQPLLLRLRHAEAAAFLPLDVGGGPFNSSSRWLVLREPSNSRGGAGFCGAGHEDHLLLVNVANSFVRVTDDFLAQSCLLSISMNMDEFGELVGSIGIDKQAGQVSLEQVVSSESGSIRRSVLLTVVSGRMIVSVGSSKH